MLFIGFALERLDSEVFGVHSDWLAWSAGAVVVAYVMFSIWNWRCPSCDKYLGKGINPAFCVKCGVRLKPQ